MSKKLTLHQFIRKYHINQEWLAKSINMNYSTFKQKLNKKFPMEFSTEEVDNLLKNMREYATDILNFSMDYEDSKIQTCEPAAK